MDDGTEPQGGGKLSRDQPCCSFHCVCRHLGQRLAVCKQGRHLGCDEHRSRIFSSVCHVHCFRSSHSRNMYAGTEGRGVLRSPNNGTTWTTMNTGLGNANVRSVVINPRTPSILYAGTDGGVFRYGPVSSSTKVI